MTWRVFRHWPLPAAQHYSGPEVKVLSGHYREDLPPWKNVGDSASRFPSRGSNATALTCFSMQEEGAQPRKRRRRRFSSLEDSPSVDKPVASSAAPGSVPPDGDGAQSSLQWAGCRSVDNYERLNFIDEGAYGRVFRTREIATGTIYALKQVKITQEREGFPVTSLREISTLFSVSHPNIVHLKEVVVGDALSSVYMVLEYAAHDVLSILTRMRRPYSQSEVKSLMLQLLRGVAHLHDNWVMHRDLKTANLLLTDEGVLKICDFGLARDFGDADARHTPGVVTLWYRAPEVLLADPNYTCAVDMWAAGCIFAELLLMDALFQGKGELDQIAKIGDMLGKPCEAVWPGLGKLPNATRIVFRGPEKSRLRECLMPKSGAGRAYITPKGIDLIERMLTYDPRARITAEEAIAHPYFAEAPPPKDPALIQTFPDDRRGNN